MALGAGNPGVGPIAVGNVFGLHDPVAGLAAKLDGLGEMVGLVGPEGGDEQEQHAAREEKAQQPSVAGEGEVNPQCRQRAGGLEDLAMAQEGAK